MSAAQPFPTIALVGRYASPGIAEPLNRIAAFLTGRGHRVLIDAETARLTPLPEGEASRPFRQFPFRQVIVRMFRLPRVTGGQTCTRRQFSR